MRNVCAGRRIEMQGTVQGVGLRPWIHRLALEENVAGRVRNGPQGVTIEAFGTTADLDTFFRRLSQSLPPAASVDRLIARAIPAEDARGFVIEASEAEGERAVSIPPDLATCDACLAEVQDPADRRHGYPFTNCTSCGPRFTIARDVPYDRALTSMAGFRMCAECQAEYGSVADRRFHAQPNACPRCGPRLTLLLSTGEEVQTGDPIALVAEGLRAGYIAAVKGIGGFHLACDATSAGAVARLRARKRRETRPFAVMVRDLDEARRVAAVGEDEARLLAGVARPVVLVPRRAEGPLAPGIAPGNPTVGLLLPYSPLHHRLLAEARRPLVMTSGNVTEEPMAYRDDDARRRLAGIADLLLLHDREIENRCDDSVARIIAGRPVVFRRARGYVPRPVRAPRRLERPVLAVGAHLKNAFCIAAGDKAVLGPHIGDLEEWETVRAFEEAVERLERFLRVRPEVIAHDLHPAYASTRYALARPEATKVGVQHHHAHVASAMAEQGLSGPVLGVAYDGTGYGTDGAAWGGELLLASYEAFERLATFRPLRLAGGEAAIRNVWRLALAALDDAYGGDAPLLSFPLFAGLPRREVAAVRKLVASGVRSPAAHGVGRYFDALGALVLGRAVSRHEGEVALEWNLAADPSETGRYPFDVDDGARPAVLDLRRMVRAAAEDARAGRAPSTISARFHNTLAAATGELVREAVRRVGRLPVVLTGGCFQNARLAEQVRAALGGLDVRLHGEVPPGDGGLALGQALVADAVTR